MSRPRFPHLAQARREEAAARLQQEHQRAERRQAAGQQQAGRSGAPVRPGAPLPPRERLLLATDRIARPLPPRDRQAAVRKAGVPLPPREAPAKAVAKTQCPPAQSLRPSIHGNRYSTSSSSSSNKSRGSSSQRRKPPAAAATAVKLPLPPLPGRSAPRPAIDDGKRAAPPRPVATRPASTRPALPGPGRPGSSARARSATAARTRPASIAPLRRTPPADARAKPQRRPPLHRDSGALAAPAAASACAGPPARPVSRPLLALRSAPIKAAPPASATRPAAQSRTTTSTPTAGTTDWLGVYGGILCRPDGQRVQLRGVQLPLQLHGAAAACDSAAALHDARTLLAEVPPGQRCVSLGLHLVAQLRPAALAALDQHIAQLAKAGTYTLLRMEARLWMHGHHLRLARRYAGHSAVLFGLMGRSALSAQLAAALQGLHAVHPRALVWLPLASAGVALQQGLDQGLGLLWDAERPQGPQASLLAATLGHPVLLDGWQPQVLSALAQERLITLCARGGIGWHASAVCPCSAAARAPFSGPSTSAVPFNPACKCCARPCPLTLWLFNPRSSHGCRTRITRHTHCRHGA